MKWIVPSVVLAIAALVVFQILWLMREAKMKEQEDRKRITEAIHQSADELEKREALGFIGNSLDSVFMRQSFPGDDSMRINESDTAGEVIIIKDTEIHSGPPVGVVPPMPPRPPVPPPAVGHAQFETPLPAPPVPGLPGDSMKYKIMRGKPMKDAIQDVMMHYVYRGGMPGEKLDPHTIDSTIKSNFEKKGLDLPFVANIVHDRRDRRIFMDAASTYRQQDSAWTFHVPIFRGAPTPFPSELVVTVDPGDQSPLKRILPQIMFAFLLTAGMLILFLRIYREALRQKKIGDIRRDFINNMTHEFKTPLATMSLAADTIMNDKIIGDKDKLKYYAEQIKNENRKLNQQVEKVLELSLTEKKGIALSKEEVNLVDIIRSAIQTMQLQVEAKGGAIELEGDLSDMKILADPFHLERVFLNLIDNAMKYGGNPPFIRISIEHYRSGVQVQISDNGKGIPQEEWKTIFDPFYRVSTGDVHNVKGFGLGLSYAQSVVKEHHGSLSVTKSNIAGTTFTLVLMHD